MLMSRVIKLPPVHFDIRHAWQYDLPRCLKDPDVSDALLQLYARWVDIAEFKREEIEEDDPELAQQEFADDLRSGIANLFDWTWVIRQFESDQIVEVELALCEVVLPEHEWEIVESNEHAVVANRERTLVADMVLCDRIPAAASLLYAGDESFASDPSIDRALAEFINGKVAQIEWSLAKAKEDLERAIEADNRDEGASQIRLLRLIEED
jgi:hypothetical protein